MADNKIITRLTIGGIEYSDQLSISLKKTITESNATGSFEINFDNTTGRHKTDFSINDEVIIYADRVMASSVASATTKLFTGIIEDIKFEGKPNNEKMVISGRDYGAVLQDIMVTPRVFKDMEVSKIAYALMVQNISPNLVTANNIGVTTTTLERVTFNNMSVFDALAKLGEISGFYFYVDEEKDLHFVQRNSVSSGETFDETNVKEGSFRQVDHDMFNQVTVYGDRQLTGAQEVFVSGTDSTGSVYELTDKPHNVSVQISGATNLFLQPGGVYNINNPATEDAKYLVDFNDHFVVLTSGTAAGDNVYPAGSIVIIDYDRDTPLVSTKRDSASIASYGPKHKIMIDRNVKTLPEAVDKATTFLSEHKDPIIEGELKINGLLSLTPGNTALINLPYHGVSGVNYMITEARYNFNPRNNLIDNVLEVDLNRNIMKFTDIVKNNILRIRQLEGTWLDTDLTILKEGIGSVTVSGTAVVSERAIGSSFYFHVSGHNLFCHPGALLGDMRLGSTIHNLT